MTGRPRNYDRDEDEDRRRPRLRRPAALEPLTPIRLLSDGLDAETPEILRKLERGWRERRRKVLSESSTSNAIGLDLGPKKIKAAQVKFKDGIASSPLSNRHMAQRPLPTPPTSPQPIPTPVQHASTTRPHITLLPILTANLPSTSRPVPVSSRSSSTIHVSNGTSAVAIILTLEDGSVVEIGRDGQTVSIREPSKSATRPGAARTLCLRDSSGWRQRQQEEWKGIADIVEGYKRLTPMVKLWHQLGELTVSCSQPPDITLVFTIDGNASGLSKEASDGRVESKVRIVYSPSTLSARVETSTIDRTDEASLQKLRTKRTVKIDHQHVDIAQIDRRTWSQDEKEAVRRLIVMRKEWSRFLTT